MADSFLDALGMLMGSAAKAQPEPLDTLLRAGTGSWSGADPLSSLLQAGRGMGADPLSTLLGSMQGLGGGGGSVLGGGGSITGLGGGQDTFGTLISSLAGLDKPSRNQAEWKKNKQDEDRRARANRAAGNAGSGFTPDPNGDLGQQIVGMARSRFGEVAAPVVQAFLAAEGGLGGAVGDTNISPIGSHGPFQFFGTPTQPGQLNNYAQARNLSLEGAGALARQNPIDAASFAFDTYLGSALERGIANGLQGEPLLREVLRVQNPGALNSPMHMGRYQQALQQALTQPLAAPGQPQMAPTLAAATAEASALRSPFGEAPYRIAFDVNQPYTVPLPGGTTHHRGVDLVPSSGAAMGAPVIALAPGTVVDFRQGGAQGNAVVIQAADGTYHSYFHLLNPNQFRPGTPIQAGQQIGQMGQSGSEGFPHLHLEVRRNINGDARGNIIDPLQYFGLR